MSDLIARTSEAPLPATVEAANAASAAKDWPRAAALWDELRAARPHDAHRWFAAGHAYSEARMLEQAERILGEAVTRFPDHRWIACRHAIVARYAGDCAEALNRAEKLRQSAPDFWPAWLESSEILVKLGRQQEAEQLLQEAATRFPDEYWPNHAAARLQADRSDPQGALRTWYALAERFPDQPSATAALKTAVAAAERSAGATAPGNRSSDTNAEGLAVRLFRRSRRPNGRIS